MTPRNILVFMIAGFFAVALLLIYNDHYKPDAIDRASLPAIADRG